MDCSFGCLCLGMPRDGLMGDKSHLILLTYLIRSQPKIVESSGNLQLNICVRASDMQTHLCSWHGIEVEHAKSV